MKLPGHLDHIQPCPYLPPVQEPVRAAEMKRFGKCDRGLEFYRQALKCAQSLWLQGYPAQAILQMNRALGAELKGMETEFPLPYAALGWVLRHRTEDQFVGNPRRHFQHYATRMNEPRRELRKWRAWGCWWIACQLLDEVDFPPDHIQIEREGVIEPGADRIYSKLKACGLPNEAELWESMVVEAGEGAQAQERTPIGKVHF